MKLRYYISTEKVYRAYPHVLHVCSTHFLRVYHSRTWFFDVIYSQFTRSLFVTLTFSKIHEIPFTLAEWTRLTFWYCFGPNSINMRSWEPILWGHAAPIHCKHKPYRQRKVVTRINFVKQFFNSEKGSLFQHIFLNQYIFLIWASFWGLSVPDCFC